MGVTNTCLESCNVSTSQLIHNQDERNTTKLQGSNYSNDVGSVAASRTDF